ncbi:MAG: hypothetical protein ACI841_003468 [Planctomycetota bacterium]|jgi:hypothetical protein
MRPDSVLVGAWLTAFAVAEILGRQSPDDWTDGAGVASFLVLAVLTWRLHQEHGLAFMTRLSIRLRALASTLSQLNIETGVDLRSTPPLPRGFPPIFKTLLRVTVGVTVVLALAHDYFPGAARDVIQSTSSALYLIGLTAFWSILVGASLLLFALPIAFIDDALDHSTRFEGKQRFMLEGLAICLHLSVLVTGIFFAPAWAPLALLSLTLAGTGILALLPGRPALAILWRKDRESAPMVMEWTSLALTNLTILACLITSLYLLSRGDRIGGGGTEETFVTSLLGLVFGWTSSMAYTVLMIGIPFSVISGRFRNPATTRATRVHIAGDLPQLLRKELKSALHFAGVRLVSEKAEASRGDVKLAYHAEGSSTPIAWQSQWPLILGEADFAEGSLLTTDLVQRVTRRDEILRRRQFLHGMQRLFKIAARRKYKAGSGFWLAPHHWFITRLSRDVDESDAWFGGPAYHPTLSIEARAHFYQIMRGCELDVIFVEDGVGYRRLKRVLAMLFEYHDLFGGERRAEERHFSGLPGVRVLIHGYDLGGEYPYEKYPEPDYEDLGRARILHVFKDRGEEETQVDTPSTPDFVPEPMLLI